MSERTYRERWMDEVLHTPLLTDTVRVALVVLYRAMDEEGHVSVSRKALSGALGRSERKATDRLSSAIGAGYLERLTRGQKYQDATYRAVLPSRVRETPGGPAEDSQGDGSQRPENRSQGDPRGSRRAQDAPTFRETPGGPAEAPAYRGTARARSKETHHGHQTPPETGTGETASPRADMKVSQSARKREALRYLNERYGLTEFEAASVVAEVKARAPKPIRSLVPYLAGMKEGDLADIVAAVQNRTAEMTAPTEHGDAEDDGEDDRPARPAMPDWCGHCDRRTRFIELLDGRPKRCPTCHPLNNQETA